MTDESLRTLGRYAAGLTYDDLPASTVQAVKQRILDSIGCGLGGYLWETGKAVRGMVGPGDPAFSARVIGSHQRTTPEMAAFANASMIRDLDHSDVYRPSVTSGGHPSNCIAAPLSVAEAVGATGRDLITAVALGYETYVPFVEGGATIKAEFEFDGLMASVASALAAGKLLGLDEEQLCTTASIALLANVGLGLRRLGKVSMYKQLYAGMAARQGIFAALMARAGLTAPDETIDSKQAGLRHVVMTDGVFALDRLAGPGEQFMVERTVIKAFPIGGGVHLSAFAAMDLREQVRADEIATIVVRTENYGLATSALPQHWHPETRETADHSIPVAVALTLVDGAITAESWKKERFKAPEVLDLIARIRVEEEPEFTQQFPAKKNIAIEATTHGGERRSVHKILTAEDDRASADVVDAKFLRYANAILTPAQAAATQDAVWHLDELDEAGRILDNLLA